MSNGPESRFRSRKSATDDVNHEIGLYTAGARLLRANAQSLS